MVISEFVRSLLSKRGITEEHDIAAFLNPDYQLHTHSPFLLQGMDIAVGRLLAAIEKKERIAVYADFDCDGIPGAALLSDFFKKVGHENLEIYIPHRDREGYGFHKEAIEELATSGVSLIITVDVGTSAVESAQFAKEKGIDVIVTDHHEIMRELPQCVALLNPKLGEYPFRDLCGAAVAFKLAQATLIEGRKRNIDAFVKIQEGWEKWLLDLVAIATVADLVPLVGENRVLAHFGLRVLRRTPRKGIVALCNKLRLRRSELTEGEIAFSIAPRVNAASRMDTPEFAFRLLVTTDSAEAERLATNLEELNTQRKSVVAALVKQARKTVRTRFTSGERVVVLGNTEWRPSLLGLAANSIMEERGGIVCLWGRDASGKLKGSCRSDGALSVVELFSNAKDALIEYGGHEKSGGFTVSHERVHKLQDAFASAADQGKISTTVLEVHDEHISLSQVGESLFSEVSQLAPFGIGNPKPLFLLHPISITSVKRFGKNSNHVEIMVSCERTGIPARAFDFFRSPEDFTQVPSERSSAKLLTTIERDTYRGGLVLRLKDVLPAGA